VHETCQQDMQPTQRTAELVLGIKVRGWKLTEKVLPPRWWTSGI